MKKLRVTVNGITYEVEVEIIVDDEEIGTYGYASTNLYSQPPAPPTPAPAAPPARSPSAAGATIPSAKTLTSPLPGVVKSVNVKVGDSVKENDPVVVLEAMKMETVISSPVNGSVKEVLVSPEQSVLQGDTLITFE
jgi:biotin carboxyl carrier protein